MEPGRKKSVGNRRAGRGGARKRAVVRALREWRGVPNPGSWTDGAGPTPVGRAVERAVRSLGLGGRLQEVTLLERWAEIVGPVVAAHAQPREVRGGVLIVEIDHPTWMWELRSMKGLMIRKINAAVGRGFIREIVFRAAG